MSDSRDRASQEQASLDPEAMVRIRPQVLFTDLEDEAVLLDPDSGLYFGLDEVGRRAWELLREHSRWREVEERLLTEYDVSPDRLRGDLAAWIGELLRHGLVEIAAP